MQAIFETVFDILYLTTVTAIGINMIKKGGYIKQYLLFGIMAVTLGGGRCLSSGSPGLRAADERA